MNPSIRLKEATALFLIAILTLSLEASLKAQTETSRPSGQAKSQVDQILTDVSMVDSLSDSGVQTWSPDVRLTFHPTFSSTSFNNAKCLAADPIAARGAEVLHLIFFDDRDGNREIYYKRSNNGGTSWSPDIRLTNDAAISHFPSIAASGAVVHVVWEEYRDGNAEIYYKRSPDAGVTWEADTRLTNNPAKSLSPS